MEYPEFIGFDSARGPDISGLVVNGIAISRQQVRTISNKRARKLRKRGELVCWSVDLGSYYWRMRRNIKPEDFYRKEDSCT